jgi:hypothetical protein
MDDRYVFMATSCLHLGRRHRHPGRRRHRPSTPHRSCRHSRRRMTCSGGWNCRDCWHHVSRCRLGPCLIRRCPPDRKNPAPRSLWFLSCRQDRRAGRHPGCPCPGQRLRGPYPAGRCRHVHGNFPWTGRLHSLMPGCTSGRLPGPGMKPLCDVRGCAASSPCRPGTAWHSCRG